MSTRRVVPDAWDDDYEAAADSKQPPPAPVPSSLPPPKISRAERRAQHDAANRALWSSAENPETFHFLETQQQQQQRDAPLRSEFKPQLKVLRRKPPSATGKSGAATNGLERAFNGISLAQRPEQSHHVQGGPSEADDLDSDEEERIEQARAFAERQEKARREREDKQKRYDEVRQRLFGSTSTSTSQPNTIAPSQSSSDRSSPMRSGNSNRGSRRGGNRRADPGRQMSSRPSSQSGSPAEQSPARTSATRQLYDPLLQDTRPVTHRRNLSATPIAGEQLVQPSRAPRGPDGSNGFNRRTG